MGYFHKCLFSFSLFFIMFSLLPLLLQTLKPLLMQFFSYIIEKSYMFLLCNGLLVFIAMYSALTSPRSYTHDEDIEYVVEKSNNVSESDFAVAPVFCENVMEFESPKEEEEEEKSMMIYMEAENVVSDAKEDEEGNENALVTTIIDDEDEHEESADDTTTTEELNKKCEDFIKKMKAKFCSERRGCGSFSFDDSNQKSLVVVR